MSLHSHNSKISRYTIKKILRCFCNDLTATQTSKMLSISRITINRWYHRFRLLIGTISNGDTLSGEVEIDESYFGATRVKGKRGRGASGKIPVLGLLKRGGKVSVHIVDSVGRKELLPIIKREVLENTTIYTDSFRTYDGLVLAGYKHYRIHHYQNEFARGINHINGIESFWSFCKRRLSKFNGVKKYFFLHIKECEFRYNYKDTMFSKLLKLVI
ncbi:IS1595 family transposase [soil metagenome]